MSELNFEVFRTLPGATVERILARLPTQQYQPGDILLKENQPNDRVFLVEQGELEAWKGEPHTPQSVRLATFKRGSCFGEMSAINGAPATAFVVATTPATVRSVRLADLPEGDGVPEKVTLNLARTLVDRLSTATESLKAQHEAELETMRVIASASAFLTRILTALSFYMFSLPGVAWLTPLLPSNSLVSFFFIGAFAWLVVDYMRGRPEVRVRNFHMTTMDWPRQLLRGLLWAVPPMLVFVAIKGYAIHAHPEKFAFFEPMRAIGRLQNPHYGLWCAFAVTYAGLTFVQEFIRCAVQGTLEMINVAVTAGAHWKAILVSDVVFASIHMHLGALFALQAFIAGLFFGYQFWRERSYLAVAVSHSIVGVWAVFVVGVPQ